MHLHRQRRGGHDIARPLVSAGPPRVISLEARPERNDSMHPTFPQ
jgi:hypothetical protein